MFWRKPLLYLRLQRGWLSVRLYEAERETGRFEGVTDAVLRQDKDGRWEALAVGNDADAMTGDGLSEATLFHAFCHPRVILDDFDKTLLLLFGFLRRANDGHKIRGRFPMVIQLTETLGGGLTDIEQRALCELGLRAGARSVAIVEGTRELTASGLRQICDTAEICSPQTI